MIGAILMGGGAALGGVAKYQESINQANAQRYNAKTKRKMADRTEKASVRETVLSHQRAREFKASQVASYLQSGAMIDSGTPLTVMVEQAGKIEMDILNKRRDRLNQARLLRSEASMLDWSAEAIEKAAPWAALGGGLSAGADMYGASGGRKEGGTEQSSSNYSYGGDFANGSNYSGKNDSVRLYGPGY